MLTNNVYMDDICYSVNAIKEAQGLSNDIDSVLDKRGFGVKEWISNKDLATNESEKKESDTISDVMEVFEREEKVLGVVWNHKTYELRFKVKADLLKYQRLQIKAKSS